MLYTIVDSADIFYRTPEITECRREEGRFLEGKITPRGFCVTRLISTNPKDYLNQTYQPGSILGSKQT